jgi:DNA-directed RNA polymerase specialized sigma subunit
LLKVERKFDKQIRAIGDEPLLHPGGNLTRIPTEFRDEDEEESEAFFEVALDEEKDDKEEDNRDVWGNNDSEAEDNDEEEDIVVDIHDAFEISDEEDVSDICKLVRQVLEDMPERQASVLKKLYFEGKTRKQIATELGITMGALYNLIKNAKHSFRASFKKLNKQ